MECCVLISGLSGGLFPTLSSPLNSTDYLDALSRIVVVSFSHAYSKRIAYAYAVVILAHFCYVLNS
jgi:hypothetical protein